MEINAALASLLQWICKLLYIKSSEVYHNIFPNFQIWEEFANKRNCRGNKFQSADQWMGSTDFSYFNKNRVNSKSKLASKS